MDLPGFSYNYHRYQTVYQGFPYQVSWLGGLYALPESLEGAMQLTHLQTLCLWFQ